MATSTGLALGHAVNCVNQDLGAANAEDVIMILAEGGGNGAVADCFEGAFRDVLGEVGLLGAEGTPDGAEVFGMEGRK